MARKSVGFTQQELAERIGVNRTAVVRIEAGERHIDVLELSRLAETTGRSVEWFVTHPPNRIASHRGPRSDSRQVNRLTDELEQAARDVELLSEIGELQAPGPGTMLEASAVRSYEEAEAAANRVREALDNLSGPLLHLTRLVERVGLLPFTLDLTSDDGSLVDGAYVRVESGWGVAIINSHGSGVTRQDGRRRFTLAHELGHHLVGDEYTSDFGIGSTADEREKLINAFAIHLLLPRPGVAEAWQRRRSDGADERAALIHVAAEYGVSWTAACGHTQRLGLIDAHTEALLRGRLPSRAEYLELGVSPMAEDEPPTVPTKFARAALSAFRRHKIAERRVLELLRGTVDQDDLPDTDALPMDALRRDFEQLP